MVRADNVRGLTEAGWRAALGHGVRRVVDLRFAGEVPGEPDAHPGVHVVPVPLYGDPNPLLARSFRERLRAAQDVAPVFAAGYVEVLASAPERVGRAIAAVADADETGCVVVHCFAGKDRTGLVSALMLAAVGVPDAPVAEDYAASDPGVAALSAEWFATARDAEELALRRKYCRSPRETMLEVLAWIGERGGAEAYLSEAGVTPSQLRRLRARLADG